MKTYRGEKRRLETNSWKEKSKIERRAEKMWRRTSMKEKERFGRNGK